MRRETLVAICVLAVISVVFLDVSAANPPGFHRDESAIAYNAYTLSASAKDEYGAPLPLFIKSFGDYKSPLYVYLLAAVFRVTGPSTAVARTFSAVLGLAAVFVLYALALAISRKQVLALAVAALAGLSPWLFESTRLVFEVALMPLLFALFLFVLFRASAGGWRRRHSIAIGLLLVALAYTYQVGRVLAPLFAIGLVLCWFRDRRRELAAVWGVFLIGVAPIGVWALAHPGALEERYRATTYVHAGMSWWDISWAYLGHYATNLNLWAWLVRGDANLNHHVHGDGSLFFVEVALALAGAAIVVLRRRSDPWWRFVLFGVLVSPVASSFTAEDFDSIRIIALPVLLPLLALPALEATAKLPRPRALLAAAALLTVFAAEAAHWQVVFDRNGPKRLSAFEVDAHSLVGAAFRRGGTVYAFHGDHTTYIDLLFDGALAHRSRSSTVILDSATRPPVGALFVGLVGECPQCPSVAQYGDFVAYTYTPARPGVLTTSFQLTSPLRPVGGPVDFLVGVHNTGAEPADHIILTVRLPAAMHLVGPPYTERGSCRGSSPIVCNIGYLPAGGSTTIRYEVDVLEGGPQTMSASLGSDMLNVNPAGTGSAFTVDLTPPAYAKSTPAPG